MGEKNELKFQNSIYNNHRTDSINNNGQQMQIKSEKKVNKKILNAIFIDPKQNRLIYKNIANINKFFQLFDRIKEQRTIEKMCNHYTVQEKQTILSHYTKLIDEVQTLMDDFQQYAKKLKLSKQKLKIDKQTYSFHQWKQAVYIVAYNGQILTETIEQRLKLIVKAFGLEERVPTISWQRWLQNCTEQMVFKKAFCGCFS